MKRSAIPVFLMLVLAACGGGGTAPTTSDAIESTNPAQVEPGSTATSTIDACSVLSDDEIETATGQRVIDRQVSDLRPDVFPSICDIELDGGGALTVSVRSTGGKAMYEDSFEPFIGDDVSAPLNEAIAGLGDKAGRTGNDELMVLAGDTLFDILYIEYGRDDKLDVVRYLSEVAVAKLPCLPSGCVGFTPPTLPSRAPATDVCALLTESDIAAATGYPVLGTEGSSEPGRPATCQWGVDADPDLQGLYWLALEIRPSGGADRFRSVETSYDPPLEHLEGLGDDAIRTATIPGGSMHVLTGDQLVTLSFSMPLSVDDPYGLLQPLLASALDRIP